MTKSPNRRRHKRTSAKHTLRADARIPVQGIPDNILAIDRHIHRHVGRVAFVFHEKVSKLVHIDVHFVAPEAGRNYWTVITSGMSDLPMNVPPNRDFSPYAELMLALPAGWPVGVNEWKKEENYWPIRCLKSLARYPHVYKTWLGVGHTVTNGDPAEPYVPTAPFVSVAINIPHLTKKAFHKLRVNSRKQVDFLSVIPLYPKELKFKLSRGFAALDEKLRRTGVTELLDTGRVSVCRR